MHSRVSENLKQSTLFGEGEGKFTVVTMKSYMWKCILCVLKIYIVTNLFDTFHYPYSVQTLFDLWVDLNEVIPKTPSGGGILVPKNFWKLLIMHF